MSMIIYENTIKSKGSLVGEFGDGMFILFGDNAPDMLKDYCYGIDVVPTNATIEVGHKLKVDGDMKEVFRTSVLREFPFPEIKGERFCPEVLVWNRIASKYKLRHINKIIYLVEYQQDGITSAITRSRMNSPIASTMTYAEMLDYNISLKWKIRSAINYWRFKYCITNKSLKTPAVKWYWKAFQIIGLIMHLKDNK